MGQWLLWIFSRFGSIDHTIYSFSCKFWHRLSTVAVKVLPVSGRSLYRACVSRSVVGDVTLTGHHQLPSDPGDLVSERYSR